MEFNQALAHRATIDILFYYARQLEQYTKTDHAELLDLLLIDRKGWFPNSFDSRLGKKRWRPYIRMSCVHTMPHDRLRPDGLNLWQICQWVNEKGDFERLSGLRCSALPISSSFRLFDLLFLATSHGLWYYVKRKIHDGDPLVCPRSKRSLAWAIIHYFLSEHSAADGLDVLELIISKGSSLDLDYEDLSPLGYIIVEYGIKPTAFLSKLLCSGADADSKGGGEATLSWIVRSSIYAPDEIDELMELLLQHGANPRSLSPSGYEPLYYSIAKGDVMCTETLLRYGADPSNVGNNVNAMDPSVDAKQSSSAKFPVGEIKWENFQRNATQLHDLLVKYKDTDRTAPLCACKQKQKVIELTTSPASLS